MSHRAETSVYTKVDYRAERWRISVTMVKTRGGPETAFMRRMHRSAC